MFQLSKGSLRKMLDGQDVSNPVLHITAIKNIQNNMDGMTRYKVTLNDGESQHNFGILATQKNTLVESGEVKVGSVIRLEEFASNILSKDPPKIVVILLNFEILGEMEMKPQTPSLNEPPVKKEAAPPQKVQDENDEPKKEMPSNAKSFFNNKEAQAFPPSKTNKPPLNSNIPTSTASNTQAGMFNGFKIGTIASLNPYQNKWSIKARVTNKSSIRTYTNAKGEGKLFNVEFMDGSGQIRATGFNQELEKFYEMLVIDSVYYVSRANLKTANRQYSKIDNDYEMTFGNDTVIELCHETENVPQVTLNVTPLQELPNINPSDLVDVIAVVKSTGDLATITTKATQKELQKRELYIIDNSNTQVTCTLWGKQAEEFDGSEHPVILFKGVRVSDFGGRSLSLTMNSTMQINPDISEAHSLRGWFDQGNHDEPVTNLSDQRGGLGSGGGAGNSNTPWKSFDTIKDDNIGMGEKPDYFQVKGTVLYAKKDNSMYQACPGENCNKKVVDQNDGTYRCEKCSKNYNEFKWRMLLQINVCDYADSNWITLFTETAENLLEVKADDLGALKSTNAAGFDEIFANAVFKEYTFKLRAKMETYNDEKRLKISGVTAESCNYLTESKRLMQSIKEFMQKTG